MAFNIQTFKTRALTAAIFVVIMLAGLLWSHWSFLLLFSIIHFGCWIEFQKLVGLIDQKYQQITPLHKNGIMLAGWFFMLFMCGEIFSINNVPLHKIGRLLLLVSGVVLPLFLVVFTKKLPIRSLLYSLAGLLYISLSWGLIMNIRSIYTSNYPSANKGWLIPVILIASIWINDTMAYIVGSFIGKTPFSKISPKKTWEGTGGGAVLCVATVSLAGYYLFNIKNVSFLVAISAIAAIAGTAGDLLESKLKRMANVKDSGQIMPGHGGFLDRFDSLLFATPFVWLYLFLFKLL